jgi:hypothetical protein
MKKATIPRRPILPRSATVATAVSSSALAKGAYPNAHGDTSQPAVGLDDLGTDWLRRRITRPAGMPGLGNDLGSVQMEADVAAFKHPVFPPYSGGNEITALTLLDGRSLAQATPYVEIRWRAFEVERKCDAGGWHLESRTALLPDQPGALVRVRIENRHGVPRRLRLGFLFSGRAMNQGSNGYSWAVPGIPTDVSSFTAEAGLGQTAHPAQDGAGVCLANEAGNAFSVQCCRPAPDRWNTGRSPAWERELKAGEAFQVSLLFSFHADRQQAEQIAQRWYGREEEAFAASRRRWESLWQAAFTPNNRIFSGSLPVVHTPNVALKQLYYMGVLSLLTCRRNYGWGKVDPAYLTLWPRRGEGSSYLAWDLPYTSGILARLDPAVLNGMMRALYTAPWLDYQVTNLFTGEHGGWPCCAQPQAVTTAALNLWRWTGDQSWRKWKVVRQPRQAKGFEAASQGQVKTAGAGRALELSGEAVFRQALEVHRERRLAGKALVDFGNRGAYLECITTYAHGTAGHTAIQAWALKESTRAFNLGATTGERADLLNAIRSLYCKGRGHFACEYPDGSRHDAANLYDVGLVLNSVGNELPPAWLGEITRFVRQELATPTWAHCLSPTDADSASGTRADHQWAGCFSSWPAQFLLGALRCGHWDPWFDTWIAGLARITAQGPFAQAYWAEDMSEPEAGAAAKCFDDLPQGNHWAIASGVHFAEMVLDGVAGLAAGSDGSLRVHEPASPLRRGLRIEGIIHRQNRYVLGKKLRRL